MMTRTHVGAQVITRQGRAAHEMSRVLPRTWQECHDELARRDIDPAWRAQIELKLESICRGSW